MIEEKKEGLKVAYKGVISEEEAAAIIKKKRARKTLKAVIFIIVILGAATAAYCKKDLIFERLQVKEEPVEQ